MFTYYTILIQICPVDRFINFGFIQYKKCIVIFIKYLYSKIYFSPTICFCNEFFIIRKLNFIIMVNCFPNKSMSFKLFVEIFKINTATFFYQRQNMNNYSSFLYFQKPIFDLQIHPSLLTLDLAL